MAEKLEMTEIGIIRLLRYGYGGILLFTIIAVISPDKAENVTKALGPVLSPLAALAIGAVIYILHRHVVGELFLYRGIHFLHSRVWDGLISKRNGTESTDTVAFLYAIGVKHRMGRAAYNIFRRRYFEDFAEKHKAKGLDFAHTELHILWLTVDEVLIAAIYLFAVGKSGLGALLLSVAAVIVIIFAAILAEVVQMQIETRLLKVAHDGGKLIPFLKGYGIIVDVVDNATKS